MLRAVADALSRQRFDNEGIVLGQIGIEISACPGGCKFCSFGEDHTAFDSSTMPDEDVLASAHNFTASRELYALFLMTMHTFDFNRLLHVVARKASVAVRSIQTIRVSDVRRSPSTLNLQPSTSPPDCH